MDEQKKPVTEYLESIESKTDSIVSLLGGQIDKSQQLEGAIAQQDAQIKSLQQQLQQQAAIQMRTNPVDQEQVLRTFIQKANKSYKWFGPSAEFAKSKMIAIISIIAVLAFGIVSTILSSISLRIYSTFTFFENIVVFCAAFQLYYVQRATIFYETKDLAEHNVDIFMPDVDGVWRDIGKEKKRYKITRWLAYISVVGNIICIWALPNSSKSIIATVMEMVFLAAVVISHFMQNNFFIGYETVYFTGKDLAGRNTVTIVYNRMLKVVMPKDEYEKKYPF